MQFFKFSLLKIDIGLCDRKYLYQKKIYTMLTYIYLLRCDLVNPLKCINILEESF